MNEDYLSEEEERSPSKLIPIALILLFLAGACFGFLKSSFFLVEHIDILGCTTLAPEELRTVANYVKNTNIFDVDLVALAKRIGTNQGGQGSHKTQASFYTGIRCDEGAIAIMPFRYYVLVDASGFAIGIAESYKEEDPPLITGIRPQQVLVGKRIDHNELDYALLVTSVLPLDVVREVSEINFSDTTGISIYLQSGTWVALGLGTRNEYLTRLDVLNSLLHKLDKETGMQLTLTSGFNL